MIQRKKYWDYNVRFIFNEGNDYSEEKKSGNEGFCSTIFQRFQFEHEQKETCGIESHEKETKHIYTSAANLLHIRIGNHNYWKWRHCKTKREK